MTFVFAICFYIGGVAGAYFSIILLTYKAMLKSTYTYLESGTSGIVNEEIQRRKIVNGFTQTKFGSPLLCSLFWPFIIWKIFASLAYLIDRFLAGYYKAYS